MIKPLSARLLEWRKYMPAYKYTLKNGKTMWYANFYYTDWTGTKKHICKRGFETKRQAKDYERAVLEKQNGNCDILFSSLAENYFEDMSHRLKPTTLENKRFLFETKLLPYFGKQKVCEIDTIKIRKWQNELIAYRDENRNPFSQTYLKTINNQMSAILNYAVSHYGLVSNPCRLAGSIGKSRAEEMNIWTQQEYERFISAVKKPIMRLAFDILFYTGIRCGELLALTPCDILFSKKIDICKNYAKIKGEEFILEPKTKKGKRCISIPDFLYDEIQQYLEQTRPESGKKESALNSNSGSRIFPFTKSALEKELKSAAKKAGLQPIRVHDLRHSHASMLIELGFAPIEIAERLGHESIKTTLDTYSHLYPDKDRKLAQCLNQFYKKENNNIKLTSQKTKRMA